jgi:hypothetical protein
MGAGAYGQTAINRFAARPCVQGGRDHETGGQSGFNRPGVTITLEVC